MKDRGCIRAYKVNGSNIGYERSGNSITRFDVLLKLFNMYITMIYIYIYICVCVCVCVINYYLH
jgi:hypothetical protein